MGPAIRRHSRIIALGDRPGARRVHDARALAGDEPAVIAGIVPGVNFRRIHRHQLLHVFERRAGLVGVDLDVVLGVDHDHAIGSEQRADPIDRVRGLAHRQADREAGGVQLLRRREIRVPGPGVGLRLVPFRLVGREHAADVDAGMLLVEVEARAAWFDLAADCGRDAAPGAFDLGQIFGDRADRAILLHQAVGDVVERLQHVLVNSDVPVAVGHDVVAGAGLGFGRRGQLVLFALRGDVVDLDLAIVLGTPFVAELGERVVGAGYPMVPDAERERAGGVTVFDIGRGNGRDGTERRAFENVAAGRGMGIRRDWVIGSSVWPPCFF